MTAEDRAMLYSIADIKRLISPVARRYGVERIALFGSYARGEAAAGSDIDLRVDSGAIRGYFKLAGFHRELEETLAAPVDVMTTGALDDEFLTRIAKEEVILYEQ
jgi:predicted nucleotidyltransferase